MISFPNEISLSLKPGRSPGLKRARREPFGPRAAPKVKGDPCLCRLFRQTPGVWVTPSSPVELILDIVPENVVAAAAKPDMLAVIFFSILLGMSIASLPDGPRTGIGRPNSRLQETCIAASE